MCVIPIGDSAVVYISEGLRYNSGLELLLLADNPFGDDGGLNLTQVLCKENTSLKVLDIHGTRMSQQTEQKVFKHACVLHSVYCRLHQCLNCLTLCLSTQQLA